MTMLQIQRVAEAIVRRLGEKRSSSQRLSTDACLVKLGSMFAAIRQFALNHKINMGPSVRWGDGSRWGAICRRQRIR